MEQFKIYISGKITGLTKPEYEALFNAAEADLRGKGYAVVSPIRIQPDTIPAEHTEEEQWRAHLKADIRELIECHAIYMLANWECSEGATLEHAIARGLNMPVYYEVAPKHREIKDAIEAVMGVPFRIIAEDNRNRWHVYARIIYAHHCKADGESTQQIALETKHDESSISYYLRHYDSEYKYNREFRKAAQRVAVMLSEKMKPAHEY